jgi:hypothetical protein
MVMQDLAATMLRVYLASLILCREDFEEEDVAFWSVLYSEEVVTVPREIMAYKRAKERLRESRAGNAQNVVAVLLYNVSHTGSRDARKKEAWEKRLEGGFSIDQVKRLDQALDLIEELRGSYLSERVIGQLLGRMVNLDRVAELIKEEYVEL